MTETITGEAELPWLRVAGKRTILVRTESGWNKITPKDVEAYFQCEAGDLLSGCRRLGNIVGDWRLIDDLARFCRNLFREIEG
ncbi:MAG: hypothetical protein QW356_07000 [Candidatus Hadarchaeales archaeon]